MKTDKELFQELLPDYLKELGSLTKAIEFLGESKTDLSHETFYKLDGLTYDEFENKYTELCSWVEHNQQEVDNIIPSMPCPYEQEIKDHQSCYNLSIL